MPTLSSHIAFSMVALGMVLTPGPNMVYLISRSICQGHAAGMISLGGVALGFLFYMACAALGITALVMAVPLAYDAFRFGGAFYLLYLAWQAVKPEARSPFHVCDLPRDTPGRLFTMGLLTNLLNPKVAVLYLSLDGPRGACGSDGNRPSALTELSCTPAEANRAPLSLTTTRVA